MHHSKTISEAYTDDKPIVTLQQEPPALGTSSSKQLTQELNLTLGITVKPIANVSSFSHHFFSTSLVKDLQESKS